MNASKGFRPLVALLMVTGLLLARVVPVPASLAVSPWPAFRHDQQHTGRSPYVGSAVSDVKWTYPIGDWVRSSPCIGSDGTVYVGSDDGKLYAVNADGTLKWTYNIGTGVDHSSPAVDSDGTVYVVSWAGDLYAVNSNGTLKWTYDVGSWVQSSPTVGNDGLIYVGGDSLFAIYPNGTLKWSHDALFGFSASPAVAADGTVYIPTHDGDLQAVSSNGVLAWSYEMGPWADSSPAVGSDGTVYAAADKTLFAVRPDGTLKWSRATGESIGYSSPAIASDGTVYVGSSDDRLYAVSSGGDTKWSYPTGGDVESSPVIGADGVIYVGSDDGKLYALNPNGTVKWSYVAGSGGVECSPAIGADGTVYVTNAFPGTGKLHAINFHAHDDSMPGVVLPKSPIADSLATPTDLNDIYRVALQGGQTLKVEMHPTAGSGDIDLALYPPGESTVTTLAGAVATSSNRGQAAEAITYTVPTGQERAYYYLRVFAYEGSAQYTLTWRVADRARVVVSASVGPSVVSYRGAVRVRGWLADGRGKLLKHKKMELQRSYNGVTWGHYGTLSSSTGAFSVSVRIDRRTYFRWRFAGDTQYAQKTSYAKSAKSRAYLTPPSYPSHSRYGVWISISGFLKPRDNDGSVEVISQKYANGRWQNLLSRSCPVSDYSTYSRYEGTSHFVGWGSWRCRARAFYSDSAHAPTYSAWRYFTVR